MILLPKHLYVPVVLQRTGSQVLLYHPLKNEGIGESLDLLSSQTTWELDSGIDKKSEILNYIPETRKAPVKDSLSQLCYLATFVPNTLTTQEYENWFRDKTAAYTILFHHCWELDHIGSARNYTLMAIEVKGGGRTLPSKEFSHSANSGLLHLETAVSSFINSHLAASTFPLGSCEGIGAVKLCEFENAGAFIRESRYPRLAQIGPGLPEITKEKIINELARFHGTRNVRTWFRRIMSQLAAMVTSGICFQKTPDNFLLNGQPLDEESWLWPSQLESFIFHVEMKTSSPIAPDADIFGEEFPRDKLLFKCSTKTIVDDLMKELIQAHSFFVAGDQIPSLPELQTFFLEHLRSLGCSEDSLEIWEILDTKDLEVLSAKLKRLGGKLELDHLDDTTIRMKITGNACMDVPQIIRSFNCLNRMDFSLTSKKLSLVANGIAKDGQSEKLSRQVLAQIGRSGFVLKSIPGLDGTPQDNRMTWSAFWCQIQTNYGEFRDLKVMAFSENQEVELSSDMNRSLLSAEVIPFAVKLRIDSEEWELPIRKCVLETRPETSVNVNEKLIPISEFSTRNIPLPFKNLDLLMAIEKGGFFYNPANGNLYYDNLEKNRIICYHDPLLPRDLKDKRIETHVFPDGTLYQEVRRKVHSILNLQSDWEAGINTRLRREIKYARSLDSSIEFFSLDDPQSDGILNNLMKFMTLKGMNAGLVAGHKKRKPIYSLNNIRCGELKISGHSIFFLISMIDDVVTADIHGFFIKPEKKLLNLTTALHYHLIQWAKANHFRYYSLGVEEDSLRKNYAGITLYKKQWNGKKYPVFVCERREEREL